MSIKGILAALVMFVAPCDDGVVSAKYDAEIRAAVTHYWPIWRQHRWCDYKAQLHVESSMRPAATSSAGARGLAQIMPATWGDIRRRAGLDEDADPYDARASIRAGAFYMQWLSQRFPRRSTACALPMEQASYHAGVGSIRRAARLARKDGWSARCWAEVGPYLASVTGKNAGVTRSYVERIDATARRLRRGAR